MFNNCPEINKWGSTNVRLPQAQARHRHNTYAELPNPHAPFVEMTRGRAPVHTTAILRQGPLIKSGRSPMIRTARCCKGVPVYRWKTWACWLSTDSSASI